MGTLGDFVPSCANPVPIDEDKELADVAKHRSGPANGVATTRERPGNPRHPRKSRTAIALRAATVVLAATGGLTSAASVNGGGSEAVDLESATASWASSAAVIASRQELATSRGGGQRVLLGAERLESIEQSARRTVREMRLAEARRIARVEARKAARREARQQARQEAREHAAEHRRMERLEVEWGAPIDGYSITAVFGQASSLWSNGVHTGVDLDTVTGTPVTSVGPGTVTAAGYDGSYGYKVVVRHDDGSESWYAHLSAINVSVGESVTNQTVIGLVGATGNVTGDHLHLEFRPGGGDPVDPVAALGAYGVNL